MWGLFHGCHGLALTCPASQLYVLRDFVGAASKWAQLLDMYQGLQGFIDNGMEVAIVYNNIAIAYQQCEW